jgi:hypothetical protein
MFFSDMMSFIVDYIEFLFEAISLIVAVVYYKKIRRSFMKWFLPFLVVIFVGEIFAYQGNLGFYFTYLLSSLESIFYCYIFYNLIDNGPVRRIMTFLTIIVLVGFLAGFLFFDVSRRYMGFFMKVRIAGSLLTAFYALFYLYTRFVKDEHNRLIKDSGFWIAFGVILYSAGLSFIFSLYSIIVEQRLMLFGEFLYRLIPRLLCVILYSSLSISIILYTRDRRDASYVQD